MREVCRKEYTEDHKWITLNHFYCVVTFSCICFRLSVCLSLCLSDFQSPSHSLHLTVWVFFTLSLSVWVFGFPRRGQIPKFSLCFTNKWNTAWKHGHRSQKFLAAIKQLYYDICPSLSPSLSPSLPQITD